MGLTLFCGKPRRGKTSCAVANIIDEDLKYCNDRYLSAKEYIETVNKNYNIELSLPPERHVVSANIDIYRKYPSMAAYKMSGFDFGVPNPHQKTKRLIPFGVYVFDEAQKYFDSKGDYSLPPWVTQAFELRGHIFLKIILICQKPKRIHSDIRSVVDEFIWIEKSVHTYKIGRKFFKSEEFTNAGELVKTKWTGRRFTEESDLFAYLSGEKHLGEKYEYIFYGNIKDHYDPYNFAGIFEDYSEDFAYYDESSTFGQKPESWSNYKKQNNGKGKKKDGEQQDNG